MTASPPNPAAHAPLTDDDGVILDAVVVGAGFGGICMGAALRRAGVTNFQILEKSGDLGGVWRDNTYPGAACDVPSHLYSFSFAPNPDWSHTFARQAEIHAYLRDCVQRFSLAPHIRYACPVAGARYDEARALWVVEAGGERLLARLLVSATGLVSRPVLPQIAGSASFGGPAFHSAHWDHACDLAGKRVGVIGTGASATQFIPVIAGQAASVTVFQRSPSYLKARGGRPYPSWQKALVRRWPLLMRPHRTLVYAKYAARVLGYGRLKSMLWLAVGKPFEHMLAREIADPVLRGKLTPDYPIGCKRILLSDDYLHALARPSVRLVTAAIARILPCGVETQDGARHELDVIIHGTGFAATGLLAPMSIRGRGGRELNAAWGAGAEAYLGMSVPGFPNFFLLCGPDTNPGHDSTVSMLESQVEHIMRCRRAMAAHEARAIEVEAAPHAACNTRLQRRPAGALWQGCTSWYLDRHGRNSANWPGFTLTYRLRARHASLLAYRFTSPLAELPDAVAVIEARSLLERSAAAFQRGFLRTCFKPLIGPPFGARTQRRIVSLLSPLMPGVRGVAYRALQVERLAVEIVTPPAAGEGAVLYLHGGGFCLGSPGTHRSITSRLARAARMPVWAPAYRLAPEHPYPAALEDALACYDAMLAAQIPAHRIVLAGDSAGASLALATALRLRARGAPTPAALALVSPVTRPPGAHEHAQGALDPMVRWSWVRQGVDWYACPPEADAGHLLGADLRGLPPMLVQVGDQEILLADTQLLARHAAACGVACRVEVHRGRWHVFHLQAFYLRTAGNAIGALAQFARERILAASAGTDAPAEAVSPR